MSRSTSFAKSLNYLKTKIVFFFFGIFHKKKMYRIYKKYLPRLLTYGTFNTNLTLFFFNHKMYILVFSRGQNLNYLSMTRRVQSSFSLQRPFFVKLPGARCFFFFTYDIYCAQYSYVINRISLYVCE